MYGIKDNIEKDGVWVMQKKLICYFFLYQLQLPLFPVAMKDLTFLKDGNDTKVDGLINFEKFRMIAKEIRHLCSMCSAKYVSFLFESYLHFHILHLISVL